MKSLEEHSDDEVPINIRQLMDQRKHEHLTRFAAGCSHFAHEIGAEATAVVVASIATSGVAIGAVLIGCLGYIMSHNHK
jgi:hypothetical protein